MLIFWKWDWLNSIHFLMYIYLLGKYKLSVLRILITGSDLLLKTKLISNCRLRKSVTAKIDGKRKNIWSIVLLSTKNSPDYQQSLSDFRTIVLDKCIKNIHWTRIKYKYSIQKTQCFIFQYLHSGLVQINTPCFGFFSVVWTGLMINISAWALIKYKPKINI